MVNQFPAKPAQKDAPDIFNPHNTPQETLPDNPLLLHEPPEKSPEQMRHEKYPIRVITGVVILVITVLAIPVGVYLNQRPTNVFIEATATPTPSPTPTVNGFTSETN